LASVAEVVCLTHRRSSDEAVTALSLLRAVRGLVTMVGAAKFLGFELSERSVATLAMLALLAYFLFFVLMALETSVATISAVIATYRRERVLIDTIDALRALPVPPDEIVVVDQTEQHEAATQAALDERAASGAIRLLRLDAASITHAMNVGLLHAQGNIALFVDDDVIPEPGFISAHRIAHDAYPHALIAGRVLQPWHEGKAIPDLPFSLACKVPQETNEFIGCNFSVKRMAAITVGGFDENFVKVAYRFEAEFAHRWRAAGYGIRFEPQATIHHLKAAAGGTRAHGLLLTTMAPAHSVGTYYFALRTMAPLRCVAEYLWRPLRSVATRHHLRRPWWIIPSFIAEVRGAVWALRLNRCGPKLLAAAAATEGGRGRG